MSAVETIRDIPVIIEHRKPCTETSTMDDDSRGFPFRNQLEDLAQRHPQLAEHLQGFPRRHTRDDDEFFKRFERPFMSRFEGFGSPFDREEFECEPQQRYQQHQSYPGYFQQDYPPQHDHQQYHQQYPQPSQQDYQAYSPEQRTSSTTNQSTQTEPDLGTQFENDPNRPGNIQQSNVTSESSTNEPLNDPEQRKSPENKRFVSSVNIPVGASHQTQQGGERVIPIRIEGRDVPATSNKATHQQEEEFAQKNSSPIYAQQQQPQHQPQQEQQEQSVPKPQPPKQPLTPVEQIQLIQQDVNKLLRQVEAFTGVYRDKNYLYLDEMLTRNLLKLDNVDTQGQDSIRSARKEAIKSIERAIGVLEAKAAANAPKEEKMETEPTSTKEKPVGAEPVQDMQTEEMPPSTENVESHSNTTKSADETAAAVPAEEQPKVEQKESQIDVETEGCATSEEQGENKPTEQQNDTTELETKNDKESGEKEEKKKTKKKKGETVKN